MNKETSEKLVLQWSISENEFFWAMKEQWHFCYSHAEPYNGLNFFIDKNWNKYWFFISVSKDSLSILLPVPDLQEFRDLTQKWPEQPSFQRTYTETSCSLRRNFFIRKNRDIQNIKGHFALIPPSKSSSLNEREFLNALVSHYVCVVSWRALQKDVEKGADECCLRFSSFLYRCVSAALTLRPWRRMKTRLKSLKECLERGRGWKDVWRGTERDSERDGRVFWEARSRDKRPNGS